MFKKKATYKPASSINGKLRKQFVAHLTTAYPHCFHGLEEETMKQKVATLVPPTLESCLALTAKGEKVTLYTQGKLPRYVQLEEPGKGLSLVPTLYTLQLAPDLLPCVVVPFQVTAFLQSGADLMMRGIQVFPQVEAGLPVAVGFRKEEGDLVLVGIGITALSKAAFDESMATSAAGKGVLMIACIGDTLHPNMTLPGPAAPLPGHAPPILQQAIQVAAQEEPLENWQEVTTELETVELAEPTQVSLQIPTTAEAEHAFEQALLYGLYQIREEAIPLALPMPSSTLMERHILPFLATEEGYETPGIKQTSWKKTSKFLAKQKTLLKCKEQQGQTIVTDVTWDAPALREFVPHPLANQEDDEPAPVKKAKPKVLDLQDLYTLPAKLAPILDFEQARLMTEQQINTLLMRYYERESLIISKHNVRVDPMLADLLLPSDYPHETVSTRVLLKRCLGMATHSYRIGDTGRVRKGVPPKVLINVCGRAGKGGRVTTVVTQLEAYFQEDALEEIAERLRVQCAASTIVRPGLKAGSMEVMVQGPWADQVRAVLEERGMAPVWITVEKTTKKK
ncbi:hypothetical protein BCR37DRAFT_390360 [Protomyces lactucae-debilis]|uniref:SUI1 domain-containing protein n=1 Tax=Protomyces lactucae-debilis TaxID=2754530 RepID=A0A1Y2FYW2_PROLT|nr:uncharacterized protein BCR37DRAFT_390360 [Protomyces lactucae-debilis]ORY87845.1 hypothetical protein BCR37DRAFT_390360 [Protomyces lactucae-debilis]